MLKYTRNPYSKPYSRAYKAYFAYTLEPETLAYLATGVSLTSAEIAVINNNIKAIKAGTPVVLSSLTAKLSAVNGTAFVTRSSVDLRPYKPFKFSFSDGAQALVGWGKTYGTGETTTTLYDEDFSSDLAGWTVSDYGMATGTFTHETDRARLAITTNSNAVTRPYIQSPSSIYTGIVGCLDYIEIDYAVGSGTVKAFFRINNTAAEGERTLAGETTLEVENRTAVSPRDQISIFFNGKDYLFSFDIKRIQVKRRNTPDTTGLVIASASGGATENWTSDGGIDPNAASFTLTITNS